MPGFVIVPKAGTPFLCERCAAAMGEVLKVAGTRDDFACVKVAMRPGHSALCHGCDQPVTADEIEIEIGEPANKLPC